MRMILKTFKIEDRRKENQLEKIPFPHKLATSQGF